jgi:hypothetical protein
VSVVVLSRVAASPMRAFWWAGTVALTVGVTVYLILVDSESVAGYGYGQLVLVGSAVHVASTGWFFTVPEVRAFAWERRRRFIVAPIVLIVGTAAAFVILPTRAWESFVVVYVAWQFLHYQKQNLGLSALAGVSYGAGSLRKTERRCIVLAACAGIVGLFGKQQFFGHLLPVDLSATFTPAKAVFVAVIGAGIWAVARRPPETRPWQFLVMYGLSLAFFAPVFIFDSTLAATGSFAIAHGYQYLLIVGLVAAGHRRVVSLASLMAVGLVGGLVLDRVAVWQHGGPIASAVFGASIGVVLSHFVVDAGLWRLRDRFPREFLTSRLPYLLNRR